MSENNFRLEQGELQAVSCHCCGKESETVHGFLYKGQRPYAVYYAGWSIAHQEKFVSMAISIGNWDEGSTSKNRVAAGLKINSTPNEFQFGFIEPSNSPWAETDLLGKMLSRPNALASPLRKDFLAAAGFIVQNDSRMHEYLEGCSTGS